MLAFIEKHNIIGVYCHQNPDGDAKGSQWGIALWLRAMFPHKDIRVVGTQEAYDNFFPKNDTSMIQEQHAALIVDTANLARVDGTLEFAIDMFKIDHHPNVEPYGSGMLVDDTRASCAEIIADIIQEANPSALNVQGAQFLLAGMMTDTMKFTTENVGEKTLQSAAFLIACGAEVSKLNQILFTRTIQAFETGRLVTSQVIWQEKFAYAVFDHHTLIQHAIDGSDLRSHVNVMAGVDAFEVWAVFTQEEDGLYRGSVRSKQHTIRDEIAKYGGGGHRLACGVKGLTQKQLDDLIGALIIISTQA